MRLVLSEGVLILWTVTSRNFTHEDPAASADHFDSQLELLPLGTFPSPSGCVHARRWNCCAGARLSGRSA